MALRESGVSDMSAIMQNPRTKARSRGRSNFRDNNYEVVIPFTRPILRLNYLRKIARGIAGSGNNCFSREIILSRPQDDDQSTDRSAQRGGDEWDFSGTRLLELPGTI